MKPILQCEPGRAILLRSADPFRSHASFTPSSVFLLSATLSSTLRVYNIHTSKVVKTLKAPQFVSEKYPSPAIVFAPPEAAARGSAPKEDSMDLDGRAVTERSKEAWVICGSETGKVVIWELNSRQVVQILEHSTGHSSSVVAVAVSPDGQTVATGSLEPEKTVCLWRHRRPAA